LQVNHIRWEDAFGDSSGKFVDVTQEWTPVDSTVRGKRTNSAHCKQVSVLQKMQRRLDKV